MKEKEKNQTFEVARKIRGDWNGIKPFTRVIPDKTKYTRKKKHKNKKDE